MRNIPYGHQSINEADVKAVMEVLNSDWLTQGPTIERFEKAVADYCGAKYAVAVSSATAGLHIACMAADVGEGDKVITSPNTFVASANCALYCGAEVEFIDVNEQTYNISVERLEEKLAQDCEKNKQTAKVIIPVHFSGQACQMEALHKVARQYGCIVIEDASHAIGGSYQAAKTGSCQFSDMTVFSFHPVKIITTAEGGMVLTNKKELYEKLLRLRSHGITRNSEQMHSSTKVGPWYYEQIELGYNYRMTDMQAALGISQLKRIDEFVKRRTYLAERYAEKLQSLPLILPTQLPNQHSAWHLYVVQLDKSVKKSRLQVFEELRAKGIGVNVHYIPVHTQPHYRRLGFRKGDFPVAEAYYENAITLPLYHGLAIEEQDYVVKSLQDVLR